MNVDVINQKADDLIESLTPKEKIYYIEIERQSTDYFDYEIRATSHEDAVTKAKFLAEDESYFMADVSLDVTSVSCDDSNEDDTETMDPNQISIFTVQVDHLLRNTGEGVNV